MPLPHRLRLALLPTLLAVAACSGAAAPEAASGALPFTATPVHRFDEPWQWPSCRMVACW